VRRRKKNAPSTVRLAAKLAAQIAGQSLPPPAMSSAASAIPDGGQIAVA